jgi:hypothetical protein
MVQTVDLERGAGEDARETPAPRRRIEHSQRIAEHLRGVACPNPPIVLLLDESVLRAELDASRPRPSA